VWCLQIYEDNSIFYPYISDSLNISGVKNIEISGDIAYAAIDETYIPVLDISNTTQPYTIATIETNHHIRDISVFDDKLFIVGQQYLSVLPVADFQIDAYTDTLLKVNISPHTLPGQYQIKAYNPKSRDTIEYSVLYPCTFPDVSVSLSINSAPVLIPFDIRTTTSELSIQDYTITAHSLNQTLISNDNITLTIT
jgi:hypothetical protein